MAYNFSLKKYANGTMQLTYYDRYYVHPWEYNDSITKESSDCYDGLRFDDIEEVNRIDPDFGLYEFGCDTPWGFVEPENIELLSDDYINSVLNSKQEILNDDELKMRHEKSVSSSLNRSIKKIYDIGRNNIWEWFFTFTLSETAVKNKYDYDECSSKVRKWFNNIRSRRCPNIKYLIVPEMHVSGAWHFHALVSNCEGLQFKKAVNNQEYRKDSAGNILLDKKGQPIRNSYFGDYLRISYPSGDYIYNVVDYDEKRYGFTTVTRVQDTRKAISYIMKYLTKDLAECTFGKKRFFYSKNLDIPEKILFSYDVNFEENSLQMIIDYIEFNFNVTLNKDFIKTVKVQNYGYVNTISYFEFDDGVSHSVSSIPGAAAAN